MSGPIDPRPDEVADELERYASRSAGMPPHDFVDRVMNAVAAEPTPRRGLIGWLVAGQPLMRLARAGLVTAALVLLVAGTIAAGQLAGIIRNNTGSSPSPSVPPAVSPSVEPTPTESLEPSPDASNEVSETPEGSASPPGATSSPNGTAEPSDDSGGSSATPKPSETPKPSPTVTPSPTPGH